MHTKQKKIQNIMFVYSLFNVCWYKMCTLIKENRYIIIGIMHINIIHKY